MSYRISIRDTELFDDYLGNGRRLPLNSQCKKNSELIAQLIPYVKGLLPKISTLTEDEITQISDGVAYLLRTDHILSGLSMIGPSFAPTPESRRKLIRGENGIFLENDPKLLVKGYRIPDDYKDVVAPEFFRCYAGTFEKLRHLSAKLSEDGKPNCFGASFPLADTTAFLLRPQDLVDYSYTPAERMKFNQGLAKDLRSI